jgi:hypothetical protein
LALLQTGLRSVGDNRLISFYFSGKCAFEPRILANASISFLRDGILAADEVGLLKPRFRAVLSLVRDGSTLALLSFEQKLALPGSSLVAITTGLFADDR